MNKLNQVQIHKAATKKSLLDASVAVIGKDKDEILRISLQVVEFNTDNHGNIMGSKGKATFFLDLKTAMLLADDIINMRVNSWAEEKQGDKVARVFRAYAGRSVARELTIRFVDGRFVVQIREGEPSVSNTGAVSIKKETSKAVNYIDLYNMRLLMSSVRLFIGSITTIEIGKNSFRPFKIKEYNPPTTSEVNDPGDLFEELDDLDL